MTLSVSIGGAALVEVQPSTLQISEVLGAPSTATFRVEDMESTLDVDYANLIRASVGIGDTIDGTLFAGQVTNVRAFIEGVRRVLEIDATSYDSLLDYTLVGHEVHQYVDMSQTPSVADWLAAASSGTPLDIPTVWMDVNANTAIALPAVDDASVVQAFLEHYWRGPALSYDIVRHCDVDSGDAISLADPNASPRRLFFGMTTLRDVLSQIASLVSPELAFWIDHNLTFHWRTLKPVKSATTTEVPSGSVLYSTPRMLPGVRDAVFSPYVASVESDGPFGTIKLEIPFDGAVDGVYVQAGTAEASGLVDFGSTYGTQTYVSAPWARLEGDKALAADYAKDEYKTEGRKTITYETTAAWYGIHVGQNFTLYHPALGIDKATSYVIRQVDVSFLPDGVRTYTLQLGDGRLRSMTSYGTRIKDPKRKAPPESVPWPDKFGIDMGWLWQVSMTDVAPAPGTSQVVFIQYTDQIGTPIPVDGLKITWGLDIALGTDPVGSDGNRTPTRYTGEDATSSSLMFYLDYPTSITVGGGKATNNLHTHEDASADDTCVVWATYQ